MDRQKRRPGRSWIHPALRGVVSVVLAWILGMDSAIAKPAAPSPLHSPEAQVTRKPTLQEQVLEIPAGSLVDVRLKTKEKLHGRLGDVSNEGFMVKFAKRDRVEERKIAFGDVKSLKYVEPGSKAGRTVVYILAGVGVALVCLLLLGVALARSN